MNNYTDWAQVNTTKSEVSSAICGHRTWKSGGSIDPLDSVAPRVLPRCRSAMPSLTWIGATSILRCENLIFGLWVNLIPAVCRFAASCR